jgi:hypothetical protein
VGCATFITSQILSVESDIIRGMIDPSEQLENLQELKRALRSALAIEGVPVVLARYFSLLREVNLAIARVERELQHQTNGDDALA